MAATIRAQNLFRLVRSGLDVRSVHAQVRRPFRFLLCGDPAIISELRTLLLSGHRDDAIPFEAAGCLETMHPHAPPAAVPNDVRAVLFLGRRGDETDFESLKALGKPVFAIRIDPESAPSGAATAPGPGSVATYVVPAINNDALRGRIFSHLVDCSRGVEIAVGRQLPPLRDAVASKLTRDAANNAFKVALASAVVDHIPVLGVVLGAVASAGDIVAITGIQMMLMLHIEAAYGLDPDVQHMWQLMPVIGGGLGWRALAREVVGFFPVAGIPIKAAIAYAGTIVVGEGVTFFLQHGEHMSKTQASQIYERTKNDALSWARDILAKFKRA
jgi:uncharacterized protein (DUF697 family)